VDGYREVVFQKMNVKTRVGMVIEAIRHGLVEL
jgi:two-component system invasion response regulator UvrY